MEVGIYDFLDGFANRFDKDDILVANFECLNGVRLSQTECMYVIDFTQNKVVFAKGFKAFLGINDEQVSLISYLESIHPEDIKMVGKISALTIEHTHANPFKNENNVLYISFRIKNADGQYVKVLSQSSVFEIGSEGQMISSLVKVSDLSFIEDGEVVRYKYVAENLNQAEFRSKVYGRSSSLFTIRELDIIKHIQKGKTSAEISTALEISKHTVATHRKKIMKKSGCHSKEELIRFCRTNGVI